MNKIIILFLILSMATITYSLGSDSPSSPYSDLNLLYDLLEKKQNNDLNNEEREKLSLCLKNKGEFLPAIEDKIKQCLKTKNFSGAYSACCLLDYLDIFASRTIIANTAIAFAEEYERLKESHLTLSATDIASIETQLRFFDETSHVSDKNRLEEIHKVLLDNFKEKKQANYISHMNKFFILLSFSKTIFYEPLVKVLTSYLLNTSDASFGRKIRRALFQIYFHNQSKISELKSSFVDPDSPNFRNENVSLLLTELQKK